MMVQEYPIKLEKQEDLKEKQIQKIRWQSTRLSPKVVTKPYRQQVTEKANVSNFQQIENTVLNLGRYTYTSAEIPVFDPKRYDKCKTLSDIILDRYGPIYRHVADISADIRNEYI